jgi:hypothetical protein
MGNKLKRMMLAFPHPPMVQERDRQTSTSMGREDVLYKRQDGQEKPRTVHPIT